LLKEKTRIGKLCSNETFYDNIKNIMDIVPDFKEDI
jgi:hypothetical protein